MSLIDLFSAESPPRPPRAQEESLFFSPGATPLASQRSVRSESPTSPSRSRARTRPRSRSRSRAGSVDAGFNALSNRHGVGRLHADVGGRELEIDDDAFAAQDPLGPGPITGGAFSALPDDNDPLEFGDDGDPVKKRRKMAKVDHERLLAPQGLPRLMKIAKSWKVKGKGRERDDLGLLVDMYTVWAHGMFPKGDFRYTIGRVEAVCRTNRMINSISGMKDTFYGRNRSRTASPVDADDVPDHGDLGELPEDIAALESAVVASQPGLHGVVSEPLFAPTHDQDEGEGEDEDELAALAEAEAEAAAAQSSRPRPRPSRPVDMGDEPLDIGEEDEW